MSEPNDFPQRVWWRACRFKSVRHTNLLSYMPTHGNKLYEYLEYLSLPEHESLLAAEKEKSRKLAEEKFQLTCALEHLRDAVCTAVNWEHAKNIHGGDAPWISQGDAKDVFDALRAVDVALAATASASADPEGGEK